MGKNFLNRYFRFKTRFGPFEIDSDQKNFFGIFLFFWSFFGPKKSIFWMGGGGEILTFFSALLKGLYCVHFALLHASLRLLSSACSLDLSNFWPKWQKIEVFANFGSKKLFFEKKFLYPLLELFISVLLSHHTHMYLYPSRRAHQMSSLHHYLPHRHQHS